MAQYVMSMLRVSKIVPPKRQIIKDISLSFFPGAKIGLLGLNGSGKSTVLRIMAGADKEYDGEVQHLPGISIGYLPQEPQLDPDKTVREEVEAGLGAVVEAKQKLEEIYAAYAEPDADFDKLAEEQAKCEAILAVAGADVENQMEIAADALRLSPWDAKIGNLSGGEKRRVALCQLLLSKPDMLLLDEPTNHLDAESVEWLEQFLVRFPGTVVAVTHDRYFLDNAAEWILELDRGHGIPWKGNYSSWLEQKEARLEQEQKQVDAHMKAMKVELEWVRSNPKARQAKSKARLARYEELAGLIADPAVIRDQRRYKELRQEQDDNSYIFKGEMSKVYHELEREITKFQTDTNETLASELDQVSQQQGLSGRKLLAYMEEYIEDRIKAAFAQWQPEVEEKVRVTFNQVVSRFTNRTNRVV